MDLKGRPPEWPSIEQMNAFATHVPLLSAAICSTAGNILELGMGHYSTPMIHYISSMTQRQAFSVDADEHWCNFFEFELSNSKYHNFYCTKGEPISEWIKLLPPIPQYDVAFIDHAPEPDRVICVELLRNRATYIVVHDTDPDICSGGIYNWGNIFETFKYHHTVNYGNNTTIVSETREIGL